MDSEGADSEAEECETPFYGCHLLSELQTLRQSDTLCDIKIIVEGTTFQAHRIVLVGCSDYFKAMFSHDMVESRQSLIQLPAMSLQIFKDLLDYAYSGKLQLSISNISGLLEGAVFLQMTSAINLCMNYLKEKMNFENGDDIVAIAEELGLPDLKQHYRQYVLNNFLDFGKTKKFLELDAMTLTNYLMDDGLKTTTEARLLKLALKWFNHDKKNRLNQVHEVMDKIRYTIDGWPTIEYAMSRDPFLSDKKCKDIIEFSTKYMKHGNRKYLFQDYRTRVRFPRKTIVQFGGIIGNTGDAAFESFLGQTGCGHNHFRHRDQERWVSLGVVGLTDLWTHCPVVEVNGFAVICGGYIHLGRMGQNGKVKVFSKDVRLFTPGGFALWDLPSMHEKRAHHVAVHLEGFLYVVGGKDSQHIHSTVELYDMQKEKWYFIQPLHEPVYDHAGAAQSDKVYISGGVVDGSVSSQLLSYCPKLGKWQRRASMLQARAGHTMTALNNKLIVCGGKCDIQRLRCLASVEIYHPNIDQWVYAAPMNSECWAMSAVVLDQKLLIVGGENSFGEIQSKIEEFDAKTCTWKNWGNLPYPMKNLGCCTLTIKWTDSDKDELDSVVDAPYCVDNSTWSDSGDDFENMCDDFEQEIWGSSSRRGGSFPDAFV